MALARISIITAFAVLATAGSAQAGGLEANGYNWDLIFDPATYAAKSTVTHVSIEHDIENPPGTVISTAVDRIHYNLAVKTDLTDAATCMISAQNPWGSGTDRDLTYAANNQKAISERVSSLDTGLTCAYGVGVAQGTVSVIGGISHQTLDYDADVFLPAGVGETSLGIGGSGVGWRIGAAYEMEEIALRVSAIYNAPVSYDLEGTAFAGTAFAGDATAEVTTPQSIELKAQTGIAPGWLALASVKWVDWSVLDTLEVNTNFPAAITSTQNYRDGWTVTGGIGHALTDDLTVLGTVTWDRGTSSVNDAGVLETGTQTDRWGATLGAAYSVSEAVELSGGVSYSRIAEGSNLDGESWDDGSVLAISASLKASF